MWCRPHTRPCEPGLSCTGRSGSRDASLLHFDPLRPSKARVTRLARVVVARQRGYSNHFRSHVAHPVKADSEGHRVASVERVEHPSPGDTEQFPESRAHQPTVATDRPARRCIRTHCGTGYALPSHLSTPSQRVCPNNHAHKPAEQRERFNPPIAYPEMNAREKRLHQALRST